MSLDASNKPLGYAYDLLFDIKTHAQLQTEVEFLAHRLKGIADLCREDGHPIDAYVLSVLGFPPHKEERL